MWREEPLGNLCIPRKGRNTDLADGLRDGYLPYLGAGQIAGDPIDKYASVVNGVSCKHEDVLILWDGERSGLVGFGHSGIVSSTAAKLVVNERIDSQYLYYFLSEQFAWIQNQRTGTGVPHVPKDLTKRLFVKYPDSDLAQKKIAKILKSSDFAIERTQALITKYENIKQGMMQDLFTRGVDENGQLRPSYDVAPHLYQETELGWIPMGWKLKPLGELIGQIDSGWSPVCDAEVARRGEWGVLKTTAVVWGGYEPTENKKLPTHEAPIDSIQARSGDILITRKGPVDRVGVAVYVFNTPDRLMFPDTVFRTRVVANEDILPEFLVKVIEDDVVQTHWRRRKIGLAEAQVNLNHGILRGTPIKFPDKGEQTNILNILSSIAAKIDGLKKDLNKQKVIKLGLMQDLLTGKVRVAEDIEERKEAVE